MLERRTLGGILAAAILVAACQGAPSSSPSTSGPAGTDGAPTTQPSVSAGDQTIVVASRETVDAAWAVETDDAFLMSVLGVGETLARTGFDGNIEPYLATEWERTGDLTWEFTLREDVTFHDGTPFDAAAVVASLEHLLGVEAPARSFNPTSIAGVAAVGEKVVEITSTEPNALIPLYLASPNTVILAAKAYGSDGIDPTEAGTGPFVMTEQNLPAGVTLVRNEDYWGGTVGLAGIDFQFVPDGATRATLLQTGEVQIASTLPIPTIPLIEANSDLKLVPGQLARTNTLYLNNQKAPLDDIRVRQAIQKAIDVDAIANQVLEGAVVPASGPFAATAAWAPAGATPSVLDVDGAKALLAEAGIAEGSLTLRLWTYPSRAELPDVAVAIQRMLSAIGINVEVRVADYAALEPDFLAGDFDMVIVSRSYLTDINDPAGYLRADYTCSGTFNIAHFCDADVDAQIEAAVSNDDPTARYSVYAALAERFQEEAVDVYLYNPQELSGTSAKISGYRVHPLEHFFATKDITYTP
jgi:peptide/nickel transport system substrate-binding protein